MEFPPFNPKSFAPTPRSAPKKSCQLIYSALNFISQHSIKEKAFRIALQRFMVCRNVIPAFEITHQTPPMQTRHIKSKSNTFCVTEAFSPLFLIAFLFFRLWKNLCFLEHKFMAAHTNTHGFTITTSSCPIQL